MTAKRDPDGDLPGARRRMSDAITDLIDDRCEYLNSRTRWIDSRYRQLTEACPGSQGQGHGHPRSVVPFWVDAVELCKEIDTAVWAWQRDPGPFDGDLSKAPTPETMRRLRILDKKTWTVDDVHNLTQITTAAKDWAARIDQLLNPEAMRSLKAADGDGWAPCPACGMQFLYRQDSGGETVRQPALQMGDDLATRCVNPKCQAEWGPQKALFLCKVLGYPVPEGVQQLCEALGIPIPPVESPSTP